MKRAKVGDFCVAEATGTGLARFSAKPKRLVLVAAVCENFAGVYPLSRQFAPNSEIVNTIPHAENCYLVSRCGLFTVPLSKLVPIGHRQDIYRHYEKDILSWTEQFVQWLNSPPSRSKLTIPIGELQALPNDLEIFREETLVAPELSEFEQWFLRPEKKKVDTSARLASNPFDVPGLRNLKKELSTPPPAKAKPVPKRELTDQELFERALLENNYMADQKRFEK